MVRDHVVGVDESRVLCTDSWESTQSHFLTEGQSIRELGHSGAGESFFPLAESDKTKCNSMGFKFFPTTSTQQPPDKHVVLPPPVDSYPDTCSARQAGLSEQSMTAVEPAHTSVTAGFASPPPYTSSHCEGALEVIRAIVAMAAPRIAVPNDLYKRGLRGSVVSLLETSLLLRAVEMHLSMLGLRLLSPRYEIRVLFAELHLLAASHCSQLQTIPRLDDTLFNKLTWLDFKRSENEVGDIAFRDESSFSYRMPTARFPVDRLIESHFSTVGFAFDNAQRSTEEGASYSATTGLSVQPLTCSLTGNENCNSGVIDLTEDDADVVDSSDPERIRGGGRERRVTTSAEIRQSLYFGDPLPSDLGYLPDGRKVLGFACDPSAQYIYTDIVDKESILVDAVVQLGSFQWRNNLSHPTTGQKNWYCVWGCFADRDLQQGCLQFTNATELCVHRNGEHSFGDIVDPTKLLPEGKPIQLLISSLQGASFNSPLSRGNGVEKACPAKSNSSRPGICLRTISGNILKFFDTSGRRVHDCEELNEQLSLTTALPERTAT